MNVFSNSPFSSDASPLCMLASFVPPLSGAPDPLSRHATQAAEVQATEADFLTECAEEDPERWDGLS